jgi:hypothetical protein
MDADFDLESEIDHLPAVQRHGDPAALGWPPTLPLEIALREHTVPDICESYGIDASQWERLRLDKVFQAAVVKYAEMLKADGMGFRLKAQLQSETLLQTSWRIIHDPDTPAAVRADLVKATWKAAGHGNNDAPQQANAFSIQINL